MRASAGASLLARVCWRARLLARGCYWCEEIRLQVQCKNDILLTLFLPWTQDFRVSGHLAHQISTPLCKVSPGEGSRLDKSTYPRVGRMNLTFGVEILQKLDLQFIYAPKKAEFADLFPFMVCK